MNINLFQEINELINSGNFEKANRVSNRLFLEVSRLKKDKDRIIYLFNLAGLFIDIGHLWQKYEICEKGLNLMINNQKEMLLWVNKSKFYYNLANGKSNMISFKFGDEINFYNIEELIELKNLYWKAFKENQKENQINIQLRVNLANSLKRQFRISEALRYYDDAIKEDPGIFPAHINRSATLKLLNSVSDSWSLKIIGEIIKGYEEAIKAKNIPLQFIETYKKIIKENIKLIEFVGYEYEPILDDIETDKEFDELNEYRKYCIKQKLTLSEHGLYCACKGSARDNLTIPLLNKAIGGDFVPKMETVLNRIKSEFSLARRNYYDYYNDKDFDNEMFEECYTELLNNEVLGIKIEKLRSSFRICFGILDKIAMAICDLYEIQNKSNVYFHNFWRLDVNDNRKKFNNIKNPGLLALYSIASDLNQYKDGEWSCFKDWRNALEHGILIVFKNNKFNSDPYASLTFENSIVKVELNDFIEFLTELLQLTRSAIFSFVFCVRSYAIECNKGGLKITLNRKNS